MTDAYFLFITYSSNSHICPLFSVNGSQFTNNTIVIHRHIVLFCVILITTAGNALSGTIPTEIGQLTELTYLRLRKYEGC
jgi:hypothetical protein